VPLTIGLASSRMSRCDRGPMADGQNVRPWRPIVTNLALWWERVIVATRWPHMRRCRDMLFQLL
jgi:hypothetical protein